MLEIYKIINGKIIGSLKPPREPNLRSSADKSPPDPFPSVSFVPSV